MKSSTFKLYLYGVALDNGYQLFAYSYAFRGHWYTTPAGKEYKCCEYRRFNSRQDRTAYMEQYKELFGRLTRI